MADKERILAITKQAKQLDQEATKLEDQSHTLPLEESELSAEQIEILAEQSVISAVEDNLFLSGYDALEDDSALDERQITHILSICEYYLPVCS